MVRFHLKLAIIGANLLAAIAAVVAGRFSQGAMPGDLAATLVVEHHWLLFLSVLFAGSFLIAWRYRDSFAISMSRMLIWAVIGYLGISHTVDLLGNHYGIIWQILDIAEGTADAGLLTALRARLFVFTVILAMAVTSIAIGFETKENMIEGKRRDD